jgi:hypothetical protein
MEIIIMIEYSFKRNQKITMSKRYEKNFLRNRAYYKKIEHAKN